MLATLKAKAVRLGLAVGSLAAICGTGVIVS
jgi:hypothetical protein